MTKETQTRCMRIYTEQKDGSFIPNPKIGQTEENKKCKHGKHIFSGVAWAKGRATIKYFKCEICKGKIPFRELAPDVLDKELEKGRAYLLKKMNDLRGKI